MNNYLTEDDLLRIFTHKNRRQKRLFIVFDLMYKFLILISVASASYIMINFPAFRDKFGFWYKYDFQTSVVSEQTELIAPIVGSELPENKKSQPPVQDNHILIPALDVNAPISFGVNNTPKEVSLGLLNGVIQINGTSQPGEKGNVYITGHSSNYVWSKGDYNSVFALLDKLVVGDMIYVRFDSVTYEYRVFDKKVVLPTDLSVMQPTNDSRLTLVTCWPVGTSLKRQIILANQIYPDPAKNKESTASIAVDKLPSGR